jgi:hypothetical protein
MPRLYEHKSKHSLIVLLENTYKKLETAKSSAVYMLLTKIRHLEDELNLRFGKDEHQSFKYKNDKETNTEETNTTDITEEPTEKVITSRKRREE